MKTAEIRKAYIDFFKERGHAHLPSSSLISDDPTLLTTIAGMVQFKPYFLGLKKPPSPRVTTHQKCLRALDLDEVGPSPRHHTFFEMMGNFSFGDYFKAEIIPWAWEFLTGVLKIDPARLRVSVYQDDDEAAALWLDGVGVPQERFYRLGEKDNYWPASCPSQGPNGPCGPCSEIFYDFGVERGCGKPECDIACNCGRFIEVWNLVFMQNERHDGGKLTPLPKKNIDTGLGLERVASVLQGTATNFETDAFWPLIQRVEKLSGKSYADSPVPFRIVADHLRGVAFLLGDGAHPSNEGLGYLLRKLLRRASRAGRRLGLDEPFMAPLVDDLVGMMGGVYEEIAVRADYIRTTLEKEEAQYNHTLTQGRERGRQLLAEARKKDESVGAIAFQLHDTYGFPQEESELIIQELGIEGYDPADFDRALEKQKERSRRGSKMDGSVFVGDAPPELTELATRDDGGTKFLGYKRGNKGVMSEGELLLILKDGRAVKEVKAGDEANFVFDQTPFYAEKGGQIGDRGKAIKHGLLRTQTGTRPIKANFYPALEIEITDTKYHADRIILHRGRVTKGVVVKGIIMTLSVDLESRQATRCHHTATHLLHAALRETLGQHVTQAGSYVGPDKLRFDFTHHSKLTFEETQKIERFVNDAIFKNLPVKTETVTIDEAKARSVIALFGEKYGDEVRVVSICEKGKKVKRISAELCGGTHMDRTGGIGPFVIVSESSVAAGIRRVEALAGKPALEWFHRKVELVGKIGLLTGTSIDNTPSAVQNLLDEKKKLKQEFQQERKRAMQGGAADLLDAVPADGGAVVAARSLPDADNDVLLNLYDEIKQKAPSHRVALIGVRDGKVSIVCRFSEDQVKAGGDAGKIVKEIAKIVGGGGGGSKQAAQAGGKLPEKVPEALEAAQRLLSASPE